MSSAVAKPMHVLQPVMRIVDIYVIDFDWVNRSSAVDNNYLLIVHLRMMDVRNHPFILNPAECVGKGIFVNSLLSIKKLGV
jgi:hypothetical protein